MAVYASGLGVLYSLWCRTSMRAMAATLATGLFIGGLYLFCCIPLMFGGGGPGKDAIIIASGCIPFLLAIPGGIYVESISYHNMSGPESNMIAAYVLGMIGYSIATAVLISSSIRNFDRFSGRTGLLPWDLSLRKKPAEPGPDHSPLKINGRTNQGGDCGIANSKSIAKPQAVSSGKWHGHLARVSSSIGKMPVLHAQKRN